jgi:hypothetical protein
MQVDEQHKVEIETRIVTAIADALEKEQVTTEELPQIADFVLKRIDAVQTEDQLAEMLTELAAQWPFFKNILEIELGRVKSALEKKIAHDVLQLANDGNIEEAIRLARTMTQKQI